MSENILSTQEQQAKKHLSKLKNYLEEHLHAPRISYNQSTTDITISIDVKNANDLDKVENILHGNQIAYDVIDGLIDSYNHTIAFSIDNFDTISAAIDEAIRREEKQMVKQRFQKGG